MSVDYTKICKIDERFEKLQREDKFLFINYNEVNWFRTNETGCEIIEKCDGTKTLEQILEEMAESKNFDVDTLKVIFAPYIENMLKSDIVYDINDAEAVAAVEQASEVVEPFVGDEISDLWIHVAGKCNLSCPFCYSLSGDNNKLQLDCNKVIAFLTRIPEEKRNSIVISGGEPFLYKDLPKLVKQLREMKYKSILVITNGTVGEELYEEVVPYVDAVQVSVDGTIPAIHNLSRGEGSFDKMVKNLERIRRFDASKLIISFTPTSNNIDDLPNLPKFAYDHYIDAIHITRLMPVGRGKKMSDNLTMESNRYSDNFKKFVDNFNNIERIIAIDSELNEGGRGLISLTFAGDQTYKVAYRQKKITCGAGLGSMSIYFDGKIYPCASLQNTEFVLGTIDDPVEQVIEKAREFMFDVSVDNLKECKKCKFKYMCGGGCRACSYACSENKDIYATDPMCERYKKEMIEIIWQLETVSTNRDNWKESPI